MDTLILIICLLSLCVCIGSLLAVLAIYAKLRTMKSDEAAKKMRLF